MQNSSEESTHLLRLQKVIADCGVTSRRKAEQLIQQGRVRVNNEVVTELGTKVHLGKDIVQVDDHILDPKSIDKIYLVLNKPRGYITSLSDPEGRDTVIDLLRDIPERVFPVGRLDYLSEGLLILTNDGDFANLVTHPKFEIEKVYEVKVFGAVTAQIIKKLKDGVQTEDGLLKPKSVRLIGTLDRKTWLEFRLTEGKNREIRKICEEVGLTIDKLKRVAIEGLSIQGIKPGEYRAFTKKQLLDKLGVNPDGSRKATPQAYISKKKSLKLPKKYNETKLMADDQFFQNFRKGQYYETVELFKTQKALKEADELKKAEEGQTTGALKPVRRVRVERSATPERARRKASSTPLRNGRKKTVRKEMNVGPTGRRSRGTGTAVGKPRRGSAPTSYRRK